MMLSARASPQSTSSTSLASSNAPVKSRPVNVFSDDGSFLERFQRSRQEEEDKRKAEETLAKKKQFADRFKTRGKRPPPPDSPRTVTSTDLDPNPAKKAKRDDVPPNPGKIAGRVGHVLGGTGTSVRPFVK